MKIFVELFGLAWRLSGTKETAVDVKPQATLRDVLVVLGQRFPALMGELIVPDSYDLRGYYMIYVDGRYVPSSLEEPVFEGEHLILMFASSDG
jgi:hypothetical protein